jgi:hypothetical protein
METPLYGPIHIYYKHRSLSHRGGRYNRFVRTFCYLGRISTESVMAK